MRVSGKAVGERLHAPAATHWALIPLVAGVILGMAFSSVLLVRPQAAITNVYLQLPDGGGEDASSRLQDLKRMLNSLEAARHSGVEKLAEEVSVKTPVYYAVVMRHRHSSEQLKVLRDTWTRDMARDKVGFFIPVEEEEEEQAVEDGHEEREEAHYGEIESSDTDPVPVVDLQTSHSDFRMDVLAHICRSELNAIKWLLLAGDNVYVKPQALETFLQHYENTLSAGYLGRPASSDGGRGSSSRACVEGPGIVLSHSVVAELCSKLESCRGSEGGGDGVVERCMKEQLGRDCSQEVEGEEHFLLVDSAVQGSITEKANAHKLDAALTVFPISDAKMMYNIHQFVVGRALNTSQHEMQSLKWSLDRMTELLPRSDQGLQTSYREHEVEMSSTEDIVSWKLVNHDALLSDEENTPTREVPGVWQSELEVMMDTAVQYLNVWADSEYFYKRIVNAYWRVDPMAGIYYIIDFEASKSGNGESAALLDRHRVTFTRSLNPAEVSPPQSLVSSRQHVNIVVCLSSEHTGRLQQFMSRLETVLEHDQRINLVAVQMRSAAERQKPRRTQNVIDAKSILSLYRTKYQSASFTVLDSPALLSRSHGIAVVLRESRPSEMLFLADLDLEFDESFLDRCRSLPLQGQQAYYPVVFSQSSPSVLASLNHSLLEGSVSRHSGHWLVGSYSTACVYAADLLAASTQSELKGIINEVDTLEVYKTLVERGYEIIRGPDKQLKRVYSTGRSCDLDLIGLMHDSCKVKGDSHKPQYIQTQLSALLFDHEGKNSEIKY